MANQEPKEEKEKTDCERLIENNLSDIKKFLLGSDKYKQIELTIIQSILLARADEAKKQEANICKQLWFNHGCDNRAMYGDDGEMQCGNCVMDFKRQPLEEIIKKLSANHKEELKLERKKVLDEVEQAIETIEQEEKIFKTSLMDTILQKVIDILRNKDNAVKDGGSTPSLT